MTQTDGIATFAALADIVMDIWTGMDEYEDEPLGEVELLMLAEPIPDSDIIAALEASTSIKHLTVAAAVAGCRGLTAAISSLCRLWRDGIDDDWLREYVRWALVVIDPPAFAAEEQRRHLTAFWNALSEYAALQVAKRGGYYQQALF